MLIYPISILSTCESEKSFVVTRDFARLAVIPGSYASAARDDAGMLPKGGGITRFLERPVPWNGHLSWRQSTTRW
ncbi:hypothetical protein NITHO_5600003 [Nitrolancea hollandica Lb]|uniref:Uncharacterized protein n=1 Tax=Nitrolancea hollandica Lb TaxID=1129897 RepID=I4EM40_9BACT|nr:hypothetical protein NITHO_5600003 [Nitrolancea hollandica Lb]